MIKILITGLVLLVPDHGHGRLHLLFPQMDTLSHPGAELHTAYLRYATSPGTDSVPMAGWDLQLDTLAEPGDAPGFPSEAIDLGELFPTGADSAWAIGEPPSLVQARITLPWPDSISGGDTAAWRLEQEGESTRYVTLSNRVILTYINPNPQPPAWTMEGLHADTMTTIPAYAPGEGVDTIQIGNLPANNSTLSGDDEAVHFQGYVDLMLTREENESTPRPHLYGAMTNGLSPFNCMIARVPIDP